MNCFLHLVGSCHKNLLLLLFDLSEQSIIGADRAVEVLGPLQILRLAVEMVLGAFAWKQLQPLEDAAVEEAAAVLQLELTAAVGTVCAGVAATAGLQTPEVWHGD